MKIKTHLNNFTYNFNKQMQGNDFLELLTNCGNVINVDQDNISNESLLKNNMKRNNNIKPKISMNYLKKRIRDGYNQAYREFSQTCLLDN